MTEENSWEERPWPEPEATRETVIILSPPSEFEIRLIKTDLCSSMVSIPEAVSQHD